MTSYDKKITDIESKHIYWCLVKLKRITPSCIERWNKDNIVLPGNQWKEIFVKTKHLTKIVKDKILNLKIMHKNYAYDLIVSKKHAFLVLHKATLNNYKFFNIT